MKYICYKRFNENGIGGKVDIKVGKDLDCERSIIKYNGTDICVNTSENAHTYFMRNDDGKGIQRGDIINSILTMLKIPEGLTPEEYEEAVKLRDKRWEKVINDPICQAYCRSGHDIWIWNHAFYNTSIESLTYIQRLIAEV